MYDIIIKNGKIIDGTGSPSFRSDIGIKDGKIARIARDLEGADTVIDATGLTVTPGFIDSHSHSDRTVFSYPDQIEKIEQGITLSVTGQCGSSSAPEDRDSKKEGSFETMADWLKAASTVPQGSSSVSFVGHGNLRGAVLGMEARKPTAEELEKMKQHLRCAMENGAIGMSIGLYYTPGCYAELSEVCELAKVVREYDGVISSHIRSEGNDLVKSMEEYLEVVRQSGVRAVVSHHKSAFRENWGKVNHTLAMIDDINAEGYDVYCDVYPYTASHTSLSSRFVPEEFHADGRILEHLENPDTRQKIKEINLKKDKGDLSWVLITSCREHPEYCGKRIPEIAAEMGCDSYEAVFRLIVMSKNVCNACYFVMCEQDVETVMKHPRAMICTDSSVAKDSKTFHPRVKGTFPRVLGEYVRCRKTMSLPEMIRKITSMPASVYGLSRKGLLRVGMDADICIFDADKIKDTSTYENCTGSNQGINYVILNGKIAVKDSTYLGERYGKVLLSKDR